MANTLEYLWSERFNATYVRPDGIVVLNQEDIPLPPGFIPDPKLYSSVLFPPQTRAGDHYHQKRQEVFIGFGKGMILMVENTRTKAVERFLMDPSFHDGKCVAFSVVPEMAHAVVNQGQTPGFMIELADYSQEKIEYQVSG